MLKSSNDRKNIVDGVDLQSFTIREKEKRASETRSSSHSRFDQQSINALHYKKVCHK